MTASQLLAQYTRWSSIKGWDYLKGWFLLYFSFLCPWVVSRKGPFNPPPPALIKRSWCLQQFFWKVSSTYNASWYPHSSRNYVVNLSFPRVYTDIVLFFFSKTSVSVWVRQALEWSEWTGVKARTSTEHEKNNFLLPPPLPSSTGSWWIPHAFIFYHAHLTDFKNRGSVNRQKFFKLLL